MGRLFNCKSPNGARPYFVKNGGSLPPYDGLPMPVYVFGDSYLKTYAIAFDESQTKEAYFTNEITDMHQWEFVAVTCDGHDVKFFKNGELSDVTEYFGNPLPSNGPLDIGKNDFDVSTAFFKGYMDDLNCLRK